jgi:hypothetical protein
MSKVALFVAVPALLGAAALAVVNVELSSQLEETQARMTELEESLRDVSEPRSEPERRTGERRDEARLRGLEDRIASLETRRLEPSVAAMSDGDVAAAAPATLVAGGTDIERAVEQVLDAREAEKRLQKREKTATRGAERLLRDVEVTDEQRGQVEGLVADHVLAMEGLRGQDLGRELAAERARELRDALRRGLEGVLDATQMEAVTPRIERRLGDESRKDAQRGGRQRRGGRRGNRAGN